MTECACTPACVPACVRARVCCRVCTASIHPLSHALHCQLMITCRQRVTGCVSSAHALEVLASTILFQVTPMCCYCLR